MHNETGQIFIAVVAGLVMLFLHWRWKKAEATVEWQARCLVENVNQQSAAQKEADALKNLLFTTDVVLLQGGRQCGRMNLAAMLSALPRDVAGGECADEKVIFDMPKVGYSVGLRVEGLHG